MQVTAIPVTSAHTDVKTVAAVQSQGFSAPCASLILLIVIGTSCTEAVLRSINKVRFLALFLSHFLSHLLKHFIAFIPRGVAALPRPNIFAVTFMEIASSVFSSWIPRNSSLRGLRRIWDIFLVIPLFSATFIIPPHRAIVPINEMHRLTASEPPLTAALPIFDVSPEIKE